MADNALVEMVRVIRRGREAVHIVQCPVEILVACPPGPVTALVDAKLPASSVGRGRGERLGNHPALADDGARTVAGLLGDRHLDAHHVPFVGGGIGILGMITERNPVAAIIQRQPNREIPVLLVAPGPILKFVGVQGKHAVIIPFEHHEFMRGAGQKQHAVDLLVPELGNISRRPDGRKGSHHVAIDGQDAEQGWTHLDKITITGGIHVGHHHGTIQRGNYPLHAVPAGNSSRLRNIHILQYRRPPMICIQIRTRGNPGRNLAPVERDPLHLPSNINGG